MQVRPIPRRALLRAGTVALTLSIFTIDGLSDLDMAIAVLYILVILLSINLWSTKFLSWICFACMSLTLIAFAINHNDQLTSAAIGRCIVSLIAIAITAILVLKHKKILDELSRSEAFLTHAQELSLTGSIGFEATEGSLFFSSGAYRILGLKNDTHVTLAQLKQRIHPDDEDAFRSVIDAAYSRAPSLQLKCRLLMPCGQLKYVEMLAQPIAKPCGMFEYVGALIDVTAARLSEDALHRAQCQLAHTARLTTLGELTASIAHEINQPLAAIMTNSEASLRWLDRSVADIDEVRGGLNRIMGETHRASEIIKRIRQWSRYATTASSSIDVREVVLDAISLVQHEVRRRCITLRTELDLEVPKVIADPIQIQQVVINLLINGMQAMSAHESAQRIMSLGVYSDDGARVVIQVQDSGTGIPEDVMPNIFNAFFTTKSDGMGMGLSICRSIIEAHGGHIWAKNALNLGATFSVSLPGKAEKRYA